jgi:Calx-beta domain
MALGPFPTEASTPLFYGSDDAGSGTFSVRWTGLTCNFPQKVSAEYADAPGSAARSEDYLIPPEQRTPDMCQTSTPSCFREANISFAVTDDLGTEAGSEHFTINLSNPQGGSLDPPSSAPFVLVDADGPTRAGFDELEYSGSESTQLLAVAVWRAGAVAAESQVPYEVRPGTGAPVSDGDYLVTSANPLVFAAGERVKLITITLVNDKEPEPTESLELALGAPTGAALDTAAMTKTVSIDDNEESASPSSRLHHPRNGRTYSAAAYQLREIHVFTEDAGGSGVVRAELALRRALRGGRCEWYTGKRFRRGRCESERWLSMQSSSPDLFYRRIGELEPSVGGRISSYTAYARAVDGAGNVERELTRGRNENTFEVKPAR